MRFTSIILSISLAFTASLATPLGFDYDDYDGDYDYDSDSLSTTSTVDDITIALSYIGETLDFFNNAIGSLNSTNPPHPRQMLFQMTGISGKLKHSVDWAVEACRNSEELSMPESRVLLDSFAASRHNVLSVANNLAAHKVDFDGMCIGTAPLSRTIARHLRRAVPYPEYLAGALLELFRTTDMMDRVSSVKKEMVGSLENTIVELESGSNNC